MSEFQDSTIASSGVEDLKEQPPPLIKMDDEFSSEPSESVKSETPLVTFDDDVPSSTTIDSAVSSEGMMEGFEMVSSTDDSKTKLASNGTHASSTNQGQTTEVSSSSSTQNYSGDKLKSWPATWLRNHNIDDRAIKLIYWNEWQKSAGVFGGLLFLLLSLTCYSFISVVTMFALSVLLVSFLYRIGMTIVNAVQKTSAEHPFRHLLDEKIELSESSVQEWSECARKSLNEHVAQLQRLFLIEDVFDSLKFGVILWAASYIGTWFSLLTMAILALIGLFTLPKLYEMYQPQVDQAYGVAKSKVVEVFNLVESKIPPKLKFYSKEKKEQ